MSAGQLSSLAVCVAIAGCSFEAGSVDVPDAAPGQPAADASAVGIRCTDKSAPARPDDTWTMWSGGLLRSVLVHVPASYDPSRGTPLVLDFHGFTSDAIQEQALSGMPAKADAAGFITLHPFGVGVPRSFNAGACCGFAMTTDVDDVAFVRALIDEASERLCIDPARVYATGMSNGGFLSHRLACELSDRIAAVAPVAATLGLATCNPSRVVPIMAFNGTADTLVPYGGDSSLGFSSVPDAFAGWAARNECTGTPMVTFAQGDAKCETYTSCAGGAQVTQCTIDGGGHTWPGGLPVPAFGKTSSDLSATDAMWSFFQAHSLADN